MTTPLEPQTPLPDDFDPIFARMRANEIGDANKPKTLLAIGAGITLLMAGVLSIVVCILLWIGVGGSGIGFFGWLVVIVVLLTPYMWWVEKRTHCNFYADTLWGEGVDWTTGAARPAPMASLIRPIDTVLVGPRMIVGGIQRVKGFEARRFDQFLTRCAILIRTLGESGGAAPLAKLPLPGETPDVLDQVIAFLDHRNWIGHSSDGQRIWLSSRAKDDLSKWNLLATAAS